MAKNNNLTDFLTDVADAIRAKKGTTEKINPQNFSSEIASIETGGITDVVSKSDVNFYDYDGTLLHSYTKDDFLALSALPDLPTRIGLICQEWNYILDDAKEYVTDYGVLDIGATYITDDGKTRLYIKIAEKGRMTVPIYFTQTVSGGVTIDWGDGSATQTVSGTGSRTTNHTYADIGEYVISLNPASGCTLGLGYNNNSYSMLGSVTNAGRVYCNMLKAVEIGSGVTSIGRSAFRTCTSLERIVIPNSVTSIELEAFYDCHSLSSIVIPNSVTSIAADTFYYCYSLSNVAISNSVTSIAANLFRFCHSLSNIIIPNSVTNIGQSTFYNCTSLESIVIPKSIKSLSNGLFNSCYSIASIVIPNSVKTINNYVFSACLGMAYCDFRASTSVPTLSNSNAFGSIPSDCKIVVPDSLYSSWTTATNWSTYASYIVKASEFNG